MSESDRLSSELGELKRKNPQRFGYLNQYWGDAQQGLNNTSRNYARVTHIHENIPDPAVGTRGLGNTLMLLTELDIIRVLTNRSNATIYDLTRYQPNRLTVLGRLLDQ